MTHLNTEHQGLHHQPCVRSVSSEGSTISKLILPYCAKCMCACFRLSLCPPVSYTRFYKEVFASVAATFPTGSKPKVVTQQISKMWREMGDSEKQPYRTAHSTETANRKNADQQLLPLENPVRCLHGQCVRMHFRACAASQTIHIKGRGSDVCAHNSNQPSEWSSIECAVGVQVMHGVKLALFRVVARTIIYHTIECHNMCFSC